MEIPQYCFQACHFWKKKKIDFPEYSAIRLNWTNTEIKQNCFLFLGLSWGFMASMSWLLLHIKVSRCLLSKSELILEALEDTTSFMMLSPNPSVMYFPPFVFSQTPFPFLEEISQLYFCISIFYIFLAFSIHRIRTVIWRQRGSPFSLISQFTFGVHNDCCILT